MLTHKYGVGLDSLPEAMEIRKTVFVDEQGFVDEFDETDKTAHHIVVLHDGSPIATGRVFPDEGSWHIGRVAVLPDSRKTGAGRYVMNTLEEIAAENGAAEVVLSAQVQASGFYERLGYSAFGEEYLDQHCPHIDMRKKIK